MNENLWKYPAILFESLRNTTEISRKVGLHADIWTRSFLNTEHDFYAPHSDIRLDDVSSFWTHQVVNGTVHILIETMTKYSLAF